MLSFHSAMKLSTVLYVEDEPDIRQIVKFILARKRIQVHDFCSGEEAVKAAPSLRPDLLILDLMLKGLDGKSTLVELRKLVHLQHVPCVFLTAKADSVTCKSIERIDKAEVMFKPFQAENLVDEISALHKKMERTI